MEQKKREASEESAVAVAASRAEWLDQAEAPLYEALADVFDFTDPELWRSNSFAALRPRLVVHVRAIVARLEYKLTYEKRRASAQPFMMYANKEVRQRARQNRRRQGEDACCRIETRLNKARNILCALEAE
jgi:hypothetical protein